MEENFWNNIGIVKAACTDILDTCKKHQQEFKSKKMKMPSGWMVGWEFVFDEAIEEVQPFLFGIELYQKYGIRTHRLIKYRGDYIIDDSFSVIHIEKSMEQPFCKEILIDVDKLREEERWLFKLPTKFMWAFSDEQIAAYLSEIKKYKPDFMATDPNMGELPVMEPYDPDVKGIKALYWKPKNAKDIFYEASNIRARVEAGGTEKINSKIEQLKQQIVELEKKL